MDGLNQLNQYSLLNMIPYKINVYFSIQSGNKNWISFTYLKLDHK